MVYVSAFTKKASQISIVEVFKKMKTKNYNLIILAFVLLLFGFDVPAAAKEQPAPTELETYFDLLQEEQVQITTGASRPMTKKKLPATVTVVSADEIKLLGLRHLTDVINYIVPGGIGDIHKAGGKGGLYCFRGITADDNGKYVFMIDGLNVTSMASAGALDEMYLGLLDDLDRIEITQGVSSTLYGDGATSGVINFITKTGNTFQGTEITSGFGSGRKLEESIKYGKKESDSRNEFYYFGYKEGRGVAVGGGSGSSTSGYGRKDHAAQGRRWDHFAPSFKAQANIQRGDFTLRTRYVQEKIEEPYVADGYDYWDISDLWAFHSYFFIQPEYKHKFNENHSIKANLSFVMDERGDEKIKDWYYSAGGILLADAGDRILTRGEKKLRGQFFHYYDGFANHKFTSGAELFWMIVGHDFKDRNYTVNSTTGAKSQSINTQHLNSAAVFAEDIWQINDKSTLFAGVRVEKHNMLPLGITPRVAFTHDLTDKTTLKFLYNSGYRVPQASYYSTNERGGYPEPDPEKVQSFEAHIMHKFSPKFSTSLMGYYSIYKDLIYSYWSGHGKYNFSEVKARGLELTGDYKTENLKLKFSHSFSEPVHFSNNAWTETLLSYNLHDWAQFPTNMTKVQAIINLIEDKCTLGLTYLRPWGIKGHRNADSKLKWPANYLNATLTLKLNKDLEFQVSGYNLTEEDSPWWGPYTSDGVSRDVDYHASYFLRLIWRF